MKEKPEPRPRKHTRLWQAYLWWYTLMELRKASNLRISAVERGDSMMDAEFERKFQETLNLEETLEEARSAMIEEGEFVPVWDWASGVKGIAAGGLLAQLLARIDDIGRFPTISKLWRFAGWGLNEGKTDYPRKGEKLPYDRILKGICWNIAVSFLKQQTPVYVDIYYEEKERLRLLYPAPVKAEDGPWTEKYTDLHIHRMALRKMIKIFLSHLWVKWREAEGLPVSEPYVQAMMGHTNIVEPHAL